MAMDTPGSIINALNSDTTQQKIPSRIILIPAGPTIQGRDGRVWMMSDPRSVVEATQARALDLVIDVCHATELPIGVAAPAVGWISSIALEADGSIGATVDWTEEGKALVASKKYRYISPVFNYDKTTLEIVDVLGAGLVNRPNLRLKALNKEEDGVDKKALCAALGLNDAATDEAVIKAATEMAVAAGAAAKAAAAKATNADALLLSQQAHAGAVDLRVYAPRTDLALMEARAINAEKNLSELKVKDLCARTEAALDAAVKAGKIAPASREAYKAMCASEEGLANFQKIAEATPATPATQSMTATAAGVQVPLQGQPPTAVNAEDAQAAALMGYTTDQWLKIKEAGK